MEVGIMDEGIPQLVPAMHEVPHLYQLQDEQDLEGVSPSFVSVQREWGQQKTWSVRTRITKDCVSSIAMEKRRTSNAELDSTLHSVPLLRDVQADQGCWGLRPKSKRMNQLPAT